MHLFDYLEAREESQAEFARRSGVDKRTVSRIANGENVPWPETCWQIIHATREEPAPDGGSVTWADLGVEVPPGAIEGTAG